MLHNVLTRSLALVLLMAAGALHVFAQGPPCVVNFNFTAQGQTTTQNNCLANTQGVVNWRLVYIVNGFTPVSLQVESAPDNNGVPGAWVAFNGTVVEGPNPATNAIQGTIRLSGYNRWVRVNAVTLTGAGNVAGVIYGCTEPGCSLLGAAGASPVTVTNTPAVNQVQVNGVTVSVNSGTKDNGTQRVVLATDQPALTTPMPQNQTQINSTTVDANSGNVGPGTQRVVLATDQPSFANPVPENETQLGGAAIALNTGVVNGGTQRVVLATDQATNTNPFNVQGPAAAGAAPVGNPAWIGGRGSGAAGAGVINPVPVCDSLAVLNAGAAASSVVIAGVAGKRTRVCSLAWSNSSAAAASIQWKSGTGTTCGTGTNNLTGVMVTTLQGVPFGIGSGLGNVLVTVAAGDDLCVTTVASTYTGWLWYEQF